MRKLLALIFAATLAAIASNGASAQDWPTRPIRVIVPLSAGSAADVMPRIVFAQVSAQLGQPIFIETSRVPPAPSAPATWQPRPPTAPRCWRIPRRTSSCLDFRASDLRPDQGLRCGRAARQPDGQVDRAADAYRAEGDRPRLAERDQLLHGLYVARRSGDENIGSASA